MTATAIPARSRVGLCDPPAAVPRASAHPTPLSAPAKAASGTMPTGPTDWTGEYAMTRVAPRPAPAAAPRR